MQRAWPAGPPHRIVFLHLDSLCCLPALDYLFSALGNRIGLVISSDRFAGSSGGFWRQLWRNFSHSGVRMTVALGFDIVALRIAAHFAAPIRWCFGRQVPLRTLREHALHVGASYVVSGDINAPAMLDWLGQFRPDLVISFHFDQILQLSFLDAAAAPVLNVHPALLPAHRGPCPSFWVLAAGETRSGVTIHRVTDASIDNGDAVARVECEVPPWISMAELDGLLFEEGARSLESLVAKDPGPQGFDPPGRPRFYESFPDRSAVRAAHRRGVRLWRLSHALRLLAALFGLSRA